MAKKSNARTFTYTGLYNKTKLNNKSFIRDEFHSWPIVHSSSQQCDSIIKEEIGFRGLAFTVSLKSIWKYAIEFELV